MRAAVDTRDPGGLSKGAYHPAHLAGRRKVSGARELLANTELLDEVHVYLKRDVSGFRNRLAFIGALRRRGFDMWIDLPQDPAGPLNQLRNMLLARLAGVRWGYGWGFVSTIRLWPQAQSEFLQFQNEVERLLAIVRKAGIAVGSQVTFPLSLGEPERTRVDELLKGSAVDEARLVAVAPAAKKNLNVWPRERFIEVGRHVAAKGFTVVVMGGRGRRPAMRGDCRDNRWRHQPCRTHLGQGVVRSPAALLIVDL